MRLISVYQPTSRTRTVLLTLLFARFFVFIGARYNGDWLCVRWYSQTTHPQHLQQQMSQSCVDECMHCRKPFAASDARDVHDCPSCGAVRV